MVGASLPLVLAGGPAYATTTGAVSPWEPDADAAAPQANIVFFDAQGNQITSGTNLSNPFAYAAATTPRDTGSTKASLSFGLPQSGQVPGNWNQTSESGNTTFSPSSSLPAGTPSDVRAFAPTYPVVVSTANISTWLSSHTPDTAMGYANTIEVRLQDTLIQGTTTYWDTDIGYNNTSSPVTITEPSPGSGSIVIPANSWIQIFPSVSASTNTLTSTLTSPQSPGTPIPLQATISPSSATGTVQFFDNGTATGGPQPVNSGVATYTDNSPTAGTNSFTASFIPGPAPGDETGLNTAGASIIGGSTGQFTMVIQAPPTNTTLVSNVNPSVVGQPVTFTATVAPQSGTGAPDGTVTFADGSTTICGPNVTLIAGTNSSTATCTPPTYTAVGTHNITATYSGSANFQGSSTTSPLAQVVNKANTMTSVMATPNPAGVSQNVTITATVTAKSPGGGTPTATADFKNGGVDIAGCTAQTLNSSGVATCTATFATSGTENLTAVYSGDANYNTSTSTVFAETVNPATTTSVASTPNPSVVGQFVTYTATVSVVPPGTGTPTGTVTFTDNGTTVCSPNVALTAGSVPNTAVAPCNVAEPTAGTHTIVATYSGSPSFGGSSGSLTPSQTVNKAATSTTVSPSTNSPVVGQEDVYTANVTVNTPGAGTPTGNVTFKDNGAAISCSNPTTVDSTGKATCDPAYPAVGAHSITAAYNGDTNFSGSPDSSAAMVTVGQDSTSTTLMSSANPSNTGQPVTYTATVTANSPGAGTPTGTVTFKDGSTAICSAVTVSSGTATCTPPTYTVAGTHSITASYSGDTNFTASSSGTLSQSVSAGSPSQLGAVPYEAAFQSAGGQLWTIGSGGWTDWGLGLAPGTSPSLATWANGAYEVAFQGFDGQLWTVGSEGWTHWNLGLASGTSPSIVALPKGGYEVAFQAYGGQLWTVGTAGWTDWGLGLAPGTSPSIAALPNGGFEVAFQAYGGRLWTVGNAGWTASNLGMASGTSPSIAALPKGGYEVAFQAFGGQLWTIGAAGWTAWNVGLVASTSPSLAALPTGGFEVAFQGFGGSLWTVGSSGWKNWNLTMASGTSPSIAVTSGGGLLEALQGADGNLATVGSGSYDWGLGMATGTSPSVW